MGSASSRASASGVRDMPFSRNNRSSVVFLPPTKDKAIQPEARARLDALPETFLDFVVAPMSFAAHIEAEAA